MLFNSYTFLIFFSIILFLHYLPFSWRLKKFNLLVGSYLFYAAWNPPFVILLWISTAVDWYAARWIARTEKKNLRTAFLLLSLCTNFGLLGYFKYGGFILENAVAVLSTFGIDYRPSPLGIVLPIGISFYTFQTVSYTIDVYRGQTSPAGRFLDFALYVTFFPQLVAGPIVRSNYFLPQCETPRQATTSQFGWGMTLLVLGLFMKNVLADAVFAPVANTVFAAEVPPGMSSAWCGTWSFLGQVYCDFSGYSTCAIGIAMCLGFALPDNFHFPFGSIGIIDFWRRWHMTLSAWFRDYVYISLGGNRRGLFRALANAMFAMLLCGLWHGAAWNFLIMGGLIGLAIGIETLLRNTRLASWTIWNAILAKVVLSLFTMTLVCVITVFFRASTFSQSVGMISSMAGANWSPSELQLSNADFMMTFIPLEIIFVIHFFCRDSKLEHVIRRLPWWGCTAVISAMLIALAMTNGEENAYIYFQF